MLITCSENHDEVVFWGSGNGDCPVCQLIEDVGDNPRTCENGHRTIVYGGDDCPACDLLCQLEDFWSADDGVIPDDPPPVMEGLSKKAAAARALHWLWGQAKDRPGYRKDLWLVLQSEVERGERR
jgi:hypothetical protein